MSTLMSQQDVDLALISAQKRYEEFLVVARNRKRAPIQKGNADDYILHLVTISCKDWWELPEEREYRISL